MSGSHHARKGFPYAGLSFSADGRTVWMGDREYREIEFPGQRKRRFNQVVILVILATFAGIPFLACLGLNRWLLLLLPAVFIPFLLYNRKIHRCPECSATTRQVSTPHMNSPVLFFCDSCHLFFEHGQIDGGIPFPPHQ